MDRCHAERALVVGCDGMIGSALRQHLAAARVPVDGTSRRPERGEALCLDLEADPERWEVPEDTSMAVLCAGTTALAACRARPGMSRRVNVDRTLMLAERLVASGAFVVLLSTNLVFDGTRARRRSEEPVSPRTEYGRQKADAEARLLALGGSVAVVRLSKVMDATAPLVVGWRQRLRAGRAIEPLSDLVVAPVPLRFAVDVIARIGRERCAGIFQLSAPDDVTYAELGRRTAHAIGAPQDLVHPVSVAQADLDLEDVPQHTTLDTGRLEGVLGLRPPATDVVVREIVAGQGEARVDTAGSMV